MATCTRIELVSLPRQGSRDPVASQAFGFEGWARTSDHPVNSRGLYQLSYFELEPLGGLESPTGRLQGDCSPSEL